MPRRSDTTGRRPGGRHLAPRRPSRGVAIVASVTAVLGAATAVTLALVNNGSAGATRPVARANVTHSATSAPPTTTATPTPTPASASASASATPSPALVALGALVDSRSASSTSVAALDTVTGATASAGAASGMTTASAVKVQLLESLLLERQRSGTGLSSGELGTVTAMIEHSDNNAAEAVFWGIGGRNAVLGLENDLGLSTRKTVPGDDDYWGLTTTSAAQQLVLLRNLVEPDGPLDAQNRALALRLMRNVEADQTWGVPVAATSGHSAVKNGWLGVDSDGGLWAVNSLGVITVDGHTVLIAVMTQHNDSYADGVTRVQRVARAAAAAVES